MKSAPPFTDRSRSSCCGRSSRSSSRWSCSSGARRCSSTPIAPPKGAMEIYVVGKQWMWKVQHMDGQREINELHVPVGRPVKLTMGSEDVIHSFYIPAFRVKADVIPGPLQRAVVHADQARPLSPVLRGVLRHQALGNDRLGRGDGAERLPGLARRRASVRFAGGRGREAVHGSRLHQLPQRRCAGACAAV